MIPPDPAASPTDPHAPPPASFVQRNKGCLIAAGVVLGLLSFVCVAGMIAGYTWFDGVLGQVRAGAEEVNREGTEAGQGQPPSVCMTAALERADRCGQNDISCRALAEQFHRSCLSASIRPPDLCEGVPPETEIRASVDLRIARCSALGRAGDQSCQRMVGNIQRLCHSGGGRSGSP